MKSSRKKSSEQPKSRSLVKNVRGGTDFIEKVVLIALFVFAAAAGVTLIGESVLQKFTQQGTSIGGLEGTIAGGGGGGAGAGGP
jgi:hypothetical protein